MHGGHQVQRGTRCGFKAPLTNTDAKKYTAFTQSFWLVMFQLKVKGNLRPHFVCVCEVEGFCSPLHLSNTHTQSAAVYTNATDTTGNCWNSVSFPYEEWLSVGFAQTSRRQNCFTKGQTLFLPQCRDLSVLMRDNTPDHYSCGLFFHRDKWVPYDRLGKVYLKEVWKAIKVIRRRGRCYLSFNTNGNNSLKIFAIPCGNMLKLFHHYNT